MSDKMRPILYETHVKILGGPGVIKETDYFNTLYVYRIPIIKAASFAMLTLSLSADQFQQIYSLLIKSQPVYVRIKLYLSDSSKRRGKHGFVELPVGRHIIYSVLKIIPRVNITTQTKLIPVTLVMTNVLFFELNTNNDFNSLFIDKYSVDVFDAYKAYILEKPMEKMVLWRGIGDIPDGREEKYFYDQIVLKAQTDMYIPHNILNVYPFMDEYQYFFYDDFNAKANRIIGYHANLSNGDAIPAVDIYNNSDYFEVARSLRFKGSVELKNYKLANEKPANIWMTDNDCITYYHKEEDPIDQPEIAKPNVFATLHNGRRTTHKLHEDVGMKPKPNKKVEQIYTPNLFDSSLRKHYKIKEFMKNVSEALYLYEIDECHIDAIQLNYALLLDKTDPKAKFLPIGIVNIFSRVNPHQLEVSHRVRMQCLKYPGNPSPPPTAQKRIVI